MVEGGGERHPSGPVVKNLSSSTGDPGSIPGRGIKIAHAVGQLTHRLQQSSPGLLWSPGATTGEKPTPHSKRPDTDKLKIKIKSENKYW